mgnify:CR=1 FL=1
MPLTNKQYDAIMREYDRRQYHNYRIQCARKDEIYRKIPRIREIEESISSFSMAQAEKLFLSEERSSADPHALENLRRGLAALRREKELLLKQNSYPADYLEMQAAGSATVSAERRSGCSILLPGWKKRCPEKIFRRSPSMYTTKSREPPCPPSSMPAAYLCRPLTANFRI